MCAALSRLVQVTVVPAEIVKLSNAKLLIWDALVWPPDVAPGVGVGTELEPPPQAIAAIRPIDASPPNSAWRHENGLAAGFVPPL